MADHTWTVAANWSQFWHMVLEMSANSWTVRCNWFANNNNPEMRNRPCKERPSRLARSNGFWQGLRHLCLHLDHSSYFANCSSSQLLWCIDHQGMFPQRHGCRLAFHGKGWAHFGREYVEILTSISDACKIMQGSEGFVKICLAPVIINLYYACMVDRWWRGDLLGNLVSFRIGLFKSVAVSHVA